jgi:hypothetical protein
MDQRNEKSFISRRLLIKGVGLGAASGTIGVLGGTNAFAQTAPQPRKIQKVSSNNPMKITRVESVRFSDKIKIGGGAGDDQSAEFSWVRLHTDAGIIGTGETYPNINGEQGALRDMATRFLLGKDPRDIDGIWQSIYQYMSMRNAGGSDMRILSAINMAQLDV